MPRTKRGTLVRLAVCTFVWLLVASSGASAEHLPIKAYTTADGLAHDVVNRIVRDSRGFLWFCTREGLSCFDGYSFRNYGIQQGLPSALINDLLETSAGVYWVATAEGLCRFNPLGHPEPISRNRPPVTDPRSLSNAMFTVFSPAEDPRSKYVLCLLEDHAGGAIWCGTRNGLYRVEGGSGEVTITSTDLGIPDYLESRFVECLVEDRLGALWVGTDSGLYRRRPDGRIDAFGVRDGLPKKVIHALLEDREGYIWVGMPLGGLCRLLPDPAPGRNVVSRRYSIEEGLPTYWINALFQASDGTLWVGSLAGLIQLIPTEGRRDFRFRLYAEPQGLIHPEIRSLAEDGNGNLWVGMQPGGAAKIAHSGFTTFGKTEGFQWSRSILETKGRDLLVVGAPNVGLEWFINRLDEDKFIATRPRFHDAVKKMGLGWGWNQTALEDHLGEWWIATAAGVCRFPKVNNPEQLGRTPPKSVYTTRDGLAADMILRLFEDSRGDIWIGSVGEGKGPSGLSRWERSTNTLHQYTSQSNLPRFEAFYVSSFANDRAGNLWIGFSGEGGLVRYRDGRFTIFTAGDGLPTGQIRNLLIDSAGRLWVPSYRGGLSRVDDPSAERPQFVTYTTTDGLSSNEVTAVSEDRWGRIYIGTGRGIDRLDPASGHIKHYTAGDGLPLGEMEASLCDRHGALWFSFSTGLVRLVPEPDPAPAPPPILITSLRIAGEPQPISALGAAEIAPIELAASENQLQIDFVALGFSPGEGLRYRYKLEGASEEWSQLADQRTVNFANLAPGAYRFLVQAVNADNVASEKPASFSFTILHPVWRRWWSLALGGMFAALVGYAFYSYRVARLVELERIRTRIATDLHDDIGANLSLIAMASEVAKRRSPEGDQQVTEALALISGTSRELVDSMGDIVWAVNPDRDHLVDLVTRMRRFASGVFSASGIAVHFEAPLDDRGVKLRPETRREVLLIFKEAVNNIARHSECTRAEIQLKGEGGWLVLTLNDDGKGFDTTQSFDGNGLVSISRRAQRLSGTLEVVSRAGKGTTVMLKTPIR
jgi:ligand-binding sensor domain-containing protein/two-component sensor histidine kinase